jgi:hypothetical protein
MWARILHRFGTRLGRLNATGWLIVLVFVALLAFGIYRLVS